MLLVEIIEFELGCPRKQYILHYVLCILTEASWPRLLRLERRLGEDEEAVGGRDAKSFDELIRKLIDQSLRFPGQCSASTGTERSS